MLFPVSTNLCSISTNLWTSAMCNPVVGSSSIYNVFPVAFLDSSVASFTLCASPPESVVEGCPSFMYPSPTSASVWIFCLILGTFAKNSNASSTVISSTSDMLFPLYFTSNVSWLYLLPLHTSHGTYISGRKCISILRTPSPWQASHLPPGTLKLNLPFWYPLIFASFVVANKSRIISNTPVYVAGFERGVLPIGDWSIFIILSMFSSPFTPLHLPGFSVEPFISFAIVLYKTSFTSVDFPEPETPVTHVNTPSGIFTLMFFKLFSCAPSISIDLPLDFLLFLGTAIFFLPLKYCPVIEFSISLTSSAVPCAITFPPCTPRSWSDVNNLVCCIHSVFVMFYNKHSIA